MIEHVTTFVLGYFTGAGVSFLALLSIAASRDERGVLGILRDAWGER